MLPLVQELIIMKNAQPRPITLRGDLAEDEKQQLNYLIKQKTTDHLNLEILFCLLMEKLLNLEKFLKTTKLATL